MIDGQFGMNTLKDMKKKKKIKDIRIEIKELRCW